LQRRKQILASIKIMQLSKIIIKLLVTAAAGFSCCDAVGIEYFAAMGVCENMGTRERRCVMQASDCTPTHIDGQKNLQGEKYISVHQQRLQSQDSNCKCENTPVHVCLTPHPDDPSQFTKTCVADESMCDIQNGSLFGVKSDDPSLQCSCESSQDGDNNVASPTLYGACQNPFILEDFFCAYAPSDCEHPHVWVEPKDTLNTVGTTCSCDKVRTGGCVGGFTLYSDSVCAVSADDCVNTQYFPPVSLKKKQGSSCRLCKPSTNLQSLLVRDEIDSISMDGSSQTMGAKIGIAVLVLIGVAAVGAVVLRVVRRRSSGVEETVFDHGVIDDTMENANKPTSTTLQPVV